MTDAKKIARLALDLTRDFPRSPHEKLGGYVVAARTVDKCRAYLNGTLGEYHYDCPLDNFFFRFAGIEAQALSAFVGTGADDDQVGEWIAGQATQRPPIEIIHWNNEMRELRIGQLPDPQQEFLEGYVPRFIPSNRRVYTWFDVYDIEEKRI